MEKFFSPPSVRERGGREGERESRRGRKMGNGEVFLSTMHAREERENKRERK